jgi:hypothetical protein
VLDGVQERHTMAKPEWNVVSDATHHGVRRPKKECPAENLDMVPSDAVAVFVVLLRRPYAGSFEIKKAPQGTLRGLARLTFCVRVQF